MRPALLLLAWLFALPGWALNDGATTDRDGPLIHALKTLGVQYRYGGRSPETGFDCSGLVVYVFQSAWGVVLPRVTGEQRKVGRPVSRSELMPGDLLFHNTRNRPYSHVGIYVGNGHFVHAPRPGSSVRMESVHTSYWRVRFNGARRLDPPMF